MTFRNLCAPFALLGALVLAAGACSSSSGAGASGASGSGGSSAGSAGSGTGSGGSSAGSGGSSAGGGSGAGGASSCASDPLKTGLVAQQTSVSVDSFDCDILKWTAQYNEPDPMIFKAIIYVESRFDDTAVACPNHPCGIPSGWTANESGCFGLMQVVPACNFKAGDPGMLPDGHPNLTTDTSSSGWTGSIFNPNVNIELGIGGVANNRAQEKQKFSGCTEDQYTMMAIGDYNSYGSTQSCTVYNTTYDDLVLAAYKQYSSAAGYPAHNY